MQRALPFILLVVFLAAARLLGSVSSANLMNFQPLGALFFCGKALFGWRGVIAPALGWIATVAWTSANQGYGWDAQILVPVAGFAVMVGMAYFLKKAPVGKIFLGSLAGAVAFYFVSNSLSWAFDPLYSKTLAGFWQAQTIGLPGYVPSWVFLRNGLLSQAIFSAIYLLACGSLQSRETRVLATQSSR